MKQGRALTLIKPLLYASSFTSEEARIFGVSSANLAYYVKKGDIQRLGHGVYRGAKAPIVEDFRWEDLGEAIQRVRGGVICLTSALAVHGLTDEIPRQHWIAIRNDTVHRGRRDLKIVRMRNLTLGKTMLNLGGLKLPIFDRERTIVDAFRYLGKESAIKALRQALSLRRSERIDQEKLRSYAKELRVDIDPYLMAVTA